MQSGFTLLVSPLSTFNHCAWVAQLHMNTWAKKITWKCKNNTLGLPTKCNLNNLMYFSVRFLFFVHFWCWWWKMIANIETGKVREIERKTSSKITSFGLSNFNYSSKIDSIMIHHPFIPQTATESVENWNLMKLNTDIKGNKSWVERYVRFNKRKSILPKCTPKTKFDAIERFVSILCWSSIRCFICKVEKCSRWLKDAMFWIFHLEVCLIKIWTGSMDQKADNTEKAEDRHFQTPRSSICLELKLKSRKQKSKVT